MILGIAICACSFEENVPEEDVEITLPDWPPKDSFSQKYPPLSRWLIKVTGAESEYFFYTIDSTVTVRTKKNRPFSLTAQPLTLLAAGTESSYFLPAGYIYPTPKDNSAAWSQGFLATLMQKLINQGISECLPPVEIEYIISTFNWQKAQDTIDKKIDTEAKLFYNPWLLSQSSILQGISSQTFKSTMLNATGCAAFIPSQQPDIPESMANSLLSSFIPENKQLIQKKQFTLLKNSPILIGDGRESGLFINYKSSKNILLEFIFLPIYIEEI